MEKYFSINAIGADFALRIKDDSMIEDNIFDGDIVFIKECQTLKNGEIGAVLIDDGSTLKKFYKINGSIVLQASNSTYSPIVLTNKDIRILGKLVAVLNKKF